MQRRQCRLYLNCRSWRRPQTQGQPTLGLISEAMGLQEIESILLFDHPPLLFRSRRKPSIPGTMTIILSREPLAPISLQKLWGYVLLTRGYLGEEGRIKKPYQVYLAFNGRKPQGQKAYQKCEVFQPLDQAIGQLALTTSQRTRFVS